MAQDRIEAAIRDLVAALRAEMTPPDEPPAAVSIPEAARYLGIGRSTLYLLTRDGTIPTRKVGKRVLILRSDLDRYLKP